MQILVCISDVNPCPVADQQWISTVEMIDPASLGITPESVLKVASWGFGFVLLSFLVGYYLSVSIGLIKRI